MRRVITLLLTVAMALSLVVVASASQTVYLRVDEEQSGNTVTYTFTLDAASSDGVGALEFYVETTGLTYQKPPTYNTRLDNVFKPDMPGITNGSYSFTNNNNQGHFVGYGGDAKTGRLLTGEVELISLTYTITDSANYGLTVKSGSFKACYSGDKAMTDPYACKVRTGDVMKGDVNGDGKVNATDVTMARQYYRGVLTLTPEQIARIDVKPDGKINATDITLLRQYYRGVITEFPN
jgi:hypothetical protein